jgi:hypothetical protein
MIYILLQLPFSATWIEFSTLRVRCNVIWENLTVPQHYIVLITNRTFTKTNTVHKTGNVRITLWRFRANCCSGKAMSIMQPVCVLVVLVIQHAMRMRHSHLWPAPLYSIFPYSHKLHDFRGKEIIFNIKCVFRVSLSFYEELNEI